MYRRKRSEKKIGGFALVVIMLVCSFCTNVFAGQKFINADIKREMQILEGLGYEIYDKR